MLRPRTTVTQVNLSDRGSQLDGFNASHSVFTRRRRGSVRAPQLHRRRMGGVRERAHLRRRRPRDGRDRRSLPGLDDRRRGPCRGRRENRLLGLAEHAYPGARGPAPRASPRGRRGARRDAGAGDARARQDTQGVGRRAAAHAAVRRRCVCHRSDHEGFVHGRHRPRRRRVRGPRTSRGVPRAAAVQLPGDDLRLFRVGRGMRQHHGDQAGEPDAGDHAPPRPHRRAGGVPAGRHQHRERRRHIDRRSSRRSSGHRRCQLRGLVQGRPAHLRHCVLEGQARAGPRRGEEPRPGDGGRRGRGDRQERHRIMFWPCRRALLRRVQRARCRGALRRVQGEIPQRSCRSPGWQRPRSGD